MPGLQPTARRPVEPRINRHTPSPPPYCVAHIMSFHPWHCHYTITRLNYLNAAVIILAPHPSRHRGHRDRTFAAQLPGGFRCGSCGQGRCGQESCHACGGHAGISAARPARAWRCDATCLVLNLISERYRALRMMKLRQKISGTDPN